MAIKKANPMQYKSGKPRLGPLNLTQLTTLLEKTSKKKEQARIRDRIAKIMCKFETSRVPTNLQKDT